MADISKITLLNGTTYDLKDAEAREQIEEISAALAGGVTFEGVTTTEITDGSTTKNIVINGTTKEAKKGWLVAYGQKEFVFDGTKWIEMGDLGSLGTLAYKNSASGSFTPNGSVTLTNTNKTATVNTTTGTATYTPGGNVSLSNTDKTATVSPASSGTTTYTPTGSVSAPTISVATAGSTTTVKSMTGVGSLPSLTTTVANETLTFVFNQGALPTGTDVTVKNGDAAYSASSPSFTGTGVRLITDNISVPTSASFTGTGVRLITDSISVPTSASFTGTSGNVTVS